MYKIYLLMQKMMGLLSCVTFFFIFVGCNDKSIEEHGKSAAGNMKSNGKSVSGVSSPQCVSGGNGIYLASVNGEYISLYDLDQALSLLPYNQDNAVHNESTKKKMLESLILRKAVAQAYLRSVSSSEMEEIDNKIKAYKEQLLVKRYLSGHSDFKPAEKDTLARYCQDHTKKLGIRTVFSYEMITSDYDLKHKERDSAIVVLKGISKETEWYKIVNQLRKQGYPVTYKKVTGDDNLMHPQLHNVIKELKIGETSEISFIQDALYIVRKIDQKIMKPSSIINVNAQTQKFLAPVQLKKSLEEASQEVLKTATIKYFER